ncbi:MAG TPA: hypothetical protein VFW86_06980 [Candidatus Limnocylindrales bacterium]|nr:hypothetical protein [Candidatus Limnocylindrales bacterium]
MTGPIEDGTFAPVAVASRGHRGWSRLVALGWLVVVLAVLVAGIAPRIVGSGEQARPSAVLAAEATRTPGGPTQAPAPAAPTFTTYEPVELVTFAAARVGRELDVRGTIGPRSVVRLTVAVVDGNGRAQDSVALWVDDPNGGLRPAYERTFHVSFAVSTRAARRPVWVQVTAFDAVGGTIGAETIPATTLPIPRTKVPLKVNATYVR